MIENRNDLFIDKIKLSSMVILKEASLIAEFNSFMSDVKSNMFQNPSSAAFIKKINKDLQFNNIIAYIKELYDLLEFNKIKDLVKKGTVNDKDYNKIKDVISKYSNNPSEEFSYDEILEAYNQMRKIVSLSGYHEDTKNDNSDLGWED